MHFSFNSSKYAVLERLCRAIQFYYQRLTISKSHFPSLKASDNQTESLLLKPVDFKLFNVQMCRWSCESLNSPRLNVQLIQTVISALYTVILHNVKHGQLFKRHNGGHIVWSALVQTVNVKPTSIDYFLVFPHDHEQKLVQLKSAPYCYWQPLYSLWAPGACYYLWLVC